MIKRTLPDRQIRPFHRGYDHFESFLGMFFDEEGRIPPGLRTGLDVLERQAGLNACFAGLPDDAACLIEGFSTPTNGLALRQFLERRGLRSPTVRAIDVCDVGSIFRENGISMPSVEFEPADASDLSRFGDGQFDLLVQDGLLNCSPHALHPAIMSEAARVLKRGGLVIVNYTDDSLVRELDVITEDRLRGEHDVKMDWQAYGLRDLLHPGVDFPAILERLQNKTVMSPDERHFTVITPPYGYFEFFSTPAAQKTLFAEHGFEVALEVMAAEPDSHGYPCTRYRSILIRR